MAKRRVDVLVCCSPGGHLNTAISLGPIFEGRSAIFCVHDIPKDTEYLDGYKVIVVPHADRDLRFIRQWCVAVRILVTYRPRVIISTGASIAVGFFLFGKMICSCKCIFIESASRVSKPSLTGRLINVFSDRVYVRYPDLVKFFRKGRYVDE